MKRRSRWKLVRGKLKAHILEEDVLCEITTRLWWEYRIKVWRIRERIPGVGALSVAGIPDLVGWVPNRPQRLLHLDEIPMVIQKRFVNIPGQALFIECKRPGGARRTAQTQFIEEAKADGCIAFFAECWTDVITELSRYGITRGGGTCGG